MKSSPVLILSLALSIALTACQKVPTADMDADKETADVGEKVTFTNSSQDAHSYLWSFGDGTSSEERNPVKTYFEAGEYSVTLTAFSKSKSKENSNSINIVIENPNAKFEDSYAVTETIASS